MKISFHFLFLFSILASSWLPLHGGPVEPDAQHIQGKNWIAKGAGKQVQLNVLDSKWIAISKSKPKVTIEFEIYNQEQVAQLWFSHWYQTCEPSDQFSIRLVAPNNITVVYKKKMKLNGLAQLIEKGYASGTWKLILEDQNSPCTNSIRAIMDVSTIRKARTDFPITGTTSSRLKPVDKVVVNWLREKGFEAATFALAVDGKLIYQKGYGWQDEKRTKPVLPSAVMRIGSNSKPITLAAIKILLKEHNLDPKTSVWELLKADFPPLTDKKIWAQNKRFTIQDLMDHTAGLPVYSYRSDELARKLGQKKAATLAQQVGYMWHREPAGKLGIYKYSNLGYQLLAVIIQKYSGKKYNHYIEDKIAKPLHLTTLTGGGATAQNKNEIWYGGRGFGFSDLEVNPAIQPLNRKKDTRIPFPNATRLDDYWLGSASIVASTGDLVGFLGGFYHNGERKNRKSYYQSWEWIFFGSIPSCLSITHDKIIVDDKGQRHNITYAFLVNERVNNDPAIWDIGKEIDKIIFSLPWPIAIE